MAATADTLKLLHKILDPHDFVLMPTGAGRATRWWKLLPLASDPKRHATLIVTIISNRTGGLYTVLPNLRLDGSDFAPQVMPAPFTGDLHDWIDRDLPMYPTLVEIEDFYHRPIAH